MLTLGLAAYGRRRSDLYQHRRIAGLTPSATPAIQRRVLRVTIKGCNARSVLGAFRRRTTSNRCLRVQSEVLR